MNKITLWQLQFWSKSKNKAWDWLDFWKYKFFTSSIEQSKFLDFFDYEWPALIFWTGGKASIHYCEEKFSTTADCYVVTTNNKEIFLKYIYLYLKGHIYLLEEWFKWAGLKHTSKDYLKQISIPLSPLTTQRAIAAKLYKLQSLIDLKKQAITKTDDLAKSIFLDMFGDPMTNEKGWEIKMFGEVIKIDAKMVDPKKGQYESLLHIWWANIESETWKLFNLKTAKQEGIISWKFLINPNHILFSKIRPKLKKICYPKMIALCSADIYPMTVSEEQLNQHYLMYYLLWDEFTSIVSEIAEKRSQIPKVNREELEQIKIPLPPLSLQQKFADIITEIESQKSSHKLALAKLEDLYQSEMQRSFSL